MIVIIILFISLTPYKSVLVNFLSDSKIREYRTENFDQNADAIIDL